MNNTQNAIISIHPKYANAILSGKKTVELRRRIPNLKPETKLWIYSTLPVGAIIGSATVENTISDDIENTWINTKDINGISHSDFLKYFSGTEKAICIFLKRIRKGEPVSIEKLRKIRKGFHPPQVIMNISDNEANEINLLMDVNEYNPL
jgi:predicted transcriptional regulator